jgi:hypothetical protein
MFHLRAPNLTVGRRNAAHGARYWLARVFLVLATIGLSTLVMMEVSQACTGGTSLTATAKHKAHNAKQTATQQLVSRASAMSIRVTFKHIYCCTNRSGHCPGVSCAGSCCMSAVFFGGWTVTRRVALSLDVPSLQQPMTSPGLDTEFRPPRIVL